MPLQPLRASRQLDSLIRHDRILAPGFDGAELISVTKGHVLADDGKTVLETFFFPATRVGLGNRERDQLPKFETFSAASRSDA